MRGTTGGGVGLAPFSAGGRLSSPSAVEMEMKPPNEEGDEEEIAPRRLKHRALTTGRCKSFNLRKKLNHHKCFIKKMTFGLFLHYSNHLNLVTPPCNMDIRARSLVV